MLKFGIYTVEQLRSRRLTTLFGRRKRIAVRLLNQIMGDTDDDRLYDLVTCDMADDRGSFKLTLSNRFPEFDEIAIEVLRDQKFPDGPLRIHDIGVSNAQTAVEFFRALSGEFGEIDYLATDYDHQLEVINEGSLYVALSSKGEVVEITRAPFVFTPTRHEHPVVYPLNHLVCYALRMTSVKNLVERYRQGGIDPDSIEKVELFCPAAQKLAMASEGFSLGTYDLLESPEFPHKFQCVRAMNVLNPNYFSDEQMNTVLHNIASSLEERGILIAGSNWYAGSSVQGGFYRFTQGKFECLRAAEVNDFIDEHMKRFNQRPDIS
jgi:hypothetical protein